MKYRKLLLALCLTGALALPGAAVVLTAAEAENAAPIAENLTLKTYRDVGISGSFAATVLSADIPQDVVKLFGYKSGRVAQKFEGLNVGLDEAGNPYLKWKAISGAEKYFIYRSNSKSGSYTRIGSTTELKYVDKNVTEGKTYYYKVKAIHAKESANSAYSAIDSITAK